MSGPRIHIDAALAPGVDVTLPDAAARHVAAVLRLREGAALRLFDGRGHEFEATVESAGKSGVSVRVGEARAAAREPNVAITLAPVRRCSSATPPT